MLRRIDRHGWGQSVFLKGWGSAALPVVPSQHGLRVSNWPHLEMCFQSDPVLQWSQHQLFSGVRHCLHQDPNSVQQRMLWKSHGIWNKKIWVWVWVLLFTSTTIDENLSFSFFLCEMELIVVTSNTCVPGRSLSLPHSAFFQSLAHLPHGCWCPRNITYV